MKCNIITPTLSLISLISCENNNKSKFAILSSLPNDPGFSSPSVKVDLSSQISAWWKGRRDPSAKRDNRYLNKYDRMLHHLHATSNLAERLPTLFFFTVLWSIYNKVVLVLLASEARQRMGHLNFVFYWKCSSIEWLARNTNYHNNQIERDSFPALTIQ